MQLLSLSYIAAGKFMWPLGLSHRYLPVMITNQQWNLYKDYSGDPDALYRAGHKKDIAIMQEFPWGEMTEILSAIYLVQAGQLPDDYRDRKIAEFKLLECEPGVKEEMVVYSKFIFEKQPPDISTGPLGTKAIVLIVLITAFVGGFLYGLGYLIYWLVKLL